MNWPFHKSSEDHDLPVVVAHNDQDAAEAQHAIRSGLSLLVPPRPVEQLGTSDVLSALYGLGAPLILQILVTQLLLELSVWSASSRVEEVQRAMRGAAPDWSLEPPAPISAVAGSLRLVSPLGPRFRADWAPLRTLEECGKVEPIATIRAAVEPLARDEQLLIRYAVRRACDDRRADAHTSITRPAAMSGIPGLLATLFDTAPRLPLFEPALQRAFEERLNGPLFEISGMVALTGNDQGRLVSRARSLAAVFGTRFDAQFGSFALDAWTWRAAPGHPWRSSSPRRQRVPSFLVTARELAALWHPPSSHTLVSTYPYLRRPLFSLPPQAARAEGLLLGEHPQHGGPVPVHLPRRDLESGHAMILGMTGVGKSTLKHQLIRQLISLPDRPGLCLLDPNRDLSVDVALRSIPEDRWDDVVFLDLGDTAFPAGLPFFWVPPGASRDSVVQTTFAIFRLIFREHWSPTRMEDAVFALTATLCRLPNATLLDVPRLFGDATFRRRATAELADPVVREFWAEYEQLSETSRRDLVKPILYRLRSFYRSPAVRNIVCQTRGLDFRAVLERGAILLVSLAGSEIEAEADLLGELIIARLHMAALARVDRDPGERRPFYLAIDESQRFKGASLPKLLSEGRKFGVALLLTTQFLDNWGEDLTRSVLGNVGTLIAFRCGPTDSHRLSASLRPFTPEQLEDLHRHEALVKFQVAGDTMPAVDVKTLPIDRPRNGNLLAQLRARTRARYARPRAEVEAELDALYAERTARWDPIDVDEE